MKIAVTGGNGQLAQCLKDVSENSNHEFVFFDRNNLDITDEKQIEASIDASFQIVINTAAFTAVDLAETNQEQADLINHKSCEYLARHCKANKQLLIHISTDFVFDGKKNIAYAEDEPTNPISVYGLTKRNGELKIIENTLEYYIIRTSWVYSKYGSNFVKSMLRLAKTKEELGIVSDQIGTPTYAPDLAKIILRFINKKPEFGIYHFSNEGIASWYDFAKQIFTKYKINIKTNPITTSQYLTPAKRPTFSVMDKTKTKKALNCQIPYWTDSLEECLKEI